MRLLLDTEIWLWSLTTPERMSDEARDALEDAANEQYLSAASSWEISIKAALGKLPLPDAPARFVPSRMARMGVHGLAVEHPHAWRVYDLPPHHKDPFDRLLIAQALVEDLTIVSADLQFRNYAVKLMWGGR